MTTDANHRPRAGRSVAGPLLLSLLALVACAGDASPDPATLEAARQLAVPEAPEPVGAATFALAALPDGVEAISFLGDTLRRPALDDGTRARLEAALDSATARRDASPDVPDETIWVGRRLAYLGRYRDAIAVFSDGLTAFPDDARFLRHRGHRWITVRRLDAAIADLERAAALEEGTPDVIEPDGQPNALGVPLSTQQFNVWYHLGLAYYLQGYVGSAMRAWEACAAVSTNADLRVATDYWRYLALRKLNRTAEAEAVVAWVTDTVTVIENGVYRDLIRLFRGALPPDSLLPPDAAGLADVGNATAAYGVGAWHAMNGRPAEADALWRRLVAGPQWAAFGTIAAESELALERAETAP